MTYLKKIFMTILAALLLTQDIGTIQVLAKSSKQSDLDDRPEEIAPEKDDTDSQNPDSDEENSSEPDQIGSGSMPDGLPLPKPDPKEIPKEGPGFTTPGETTIPNTDGSTSTTYFLSENGVRSQSIINKSTGEILHTAFSLDESSLNLSTNSLKNPVEAGFGTNPVTGSEIALPGNWIDSRTAIPVEIEIKSSQEGENESENEDKDEKEKEKEKENKNPEPISIALSLPIEKDTGLPGTIALDYQTDAPYIQSLFEGKTSSLVVSVQDGQTIKVLNKARIFDDINESDPRFWSEASAFVSARGLMRGVGNEGLDFNPAGIVTRGQFATILYRYAGEPETAGNYPQGVEGSDYFAKASIWASDNELMGVGSLFDGYKNLTREELTTILYRFDKGSVANTNALNRFPDQVLVSNWARNGMAWAVENNLIGLGSSKLDPVSDGIRIDLALMLERYLENVTA